MLIAGREISDVVAPFIVAEAGAGHGGDEANAHKLIDEAKAAGADSIKFQCYTPDEITLDSNKPGFVIQGGPWDGRRLYDLYAKAQTPREWFSGLFLHAREVGITLFSSVFSPEGVDFLENLGCPAYKIASMEITDVNLIAYAAKTGKPIIISTGMAANEEIRNAVVTLLDISADYPHALLHCISGYPTPVGEAGLGRTDKLGWYMGAEIGISDHTEGWDVAVAATALGAQIIEKHIKLFGVETEDSPFSLNPLAFQSMCERVRAIWQACRPSEAKSEESSRQLRRSLYVVKDIKRDERFTTENVRSIRPAHGLHPKELPMILGSWAAVDIEAGTALEMGMVLPF